MAVLIALGVQSSTTYLRSQDSCAAYLPVVHAKLGCVSTGAQLASYLRIRYPDVIAGAVSSSPASFGCPGLGLVQHNPGLAHKSYSALIQG